MYEIIENCLHGVAIIVKKKKKKKNTGEFSNIVLPNANPTDQTHLNQENLALRIQRLTNDL